MANPVCLSPLKFYDSPAKQSHRKSYAYGHISPLATKVGFIPPFQFCVLSIVNTLVSVNLVDVKTDQVALSNIQLYGCFSIVEHQGYKIAIYTGALNISSITSEGQYYLELVFNDSVKYYSEVLCFTNALDDYLEIEYWNKAGHFYMKNGIVYFPSDFHFKLLLKTEIGKPEYNFEEESTKRLGYVFIESQVSKKTYRFNVLLPEFICDAMRIIRLCDSKIIRSKSDEYEAITFEMSADWQTQGDLASVTCEFETDNIIANVGGYSPEDLGGEFNADYNIDFNDQTE